MRGKAVQRERIQVTADSGAIDSVIPRRMAKGVKVKETEASRRGLKVQSSKRHGYSQ